MSIKHFADRVAFDLLQRAQVFFEKDMEDTQEKFENAERKLEGTYEFAQSDIPPTAAPSAEDRLMAWKEGINKKFHTQVQLGGRDGAIMTKTTQIKRPSQARCMWWSRVHREDHRTKLFCLNCGVGFCAPSSGRNCWSQHVRNNGPPVKKAEKKARKS